MKKKVLVAIGFISALCFLVTIPDVWAQIAKVVRLVDAIQFTPNATVPGPTSTPRLWEKTDNKLHYTDSSNVDHTIFTGNGATNLQQAYNGGPDGGPQPIAENRNQLGIFIDAPDGGLPAIPDAATPPDGPSTVPDGYTLAPLLVQNYPELTIKTQVPIGNEDRTLSPSPRAGLYLLNGNTGGANYNKTPAVCFGTNAQGPTPEQWCMQGVPATEGPDSGRFVIEHVIKGISINGQQELLSISDATVFGNETVLENYPSSGNSGDHDHGSEFVGRNLCMYTVGPSGQAYSTQICANGQNGTLTLSGSTSTARVTVGQTTIECENAGNACNFGSDPDAGGQAWGSMYYHDTEQFLGSDSPPPTTNITFYAKPIAISIGNLGFPSNVGQADGAGGAIVAWVVGWDYVLNAARSVITGSRQEALRAPDGVGEVNACTSFYAERASLGTSRVATICAAGPDNTLGVMRTGGVQAAGALASRPACVAANDGMIWTVPAAGGVAGVEYACLGASSGSYSWVTAASGDATPIVATGLTTSAMSTGLFGYVSSNSTMAKTDSATLAKTRTFGVYEGTVGVMIIGGVSADAAFTTAGGTCVAGSPAYLAAASDDTNTGAGKLTATVPASGVVAEAGIVLDSTNYAGAKKCKVLIQVKTPVQL